MKILFTCGGTAGHINPAVALARMFQERNEGCEVLFVGADNGMEMQLVPREGYEIRTVTISSFYRSLSFSGLKHNLGTLRNLQRSKKQAKRILDDFQPDLVVGTGGYASYPVVSAAAKRGIPTAVHESNAVPGLTTKMLSKHVDRVMVGFEESRQYYSDPDRVVVTGTPVRGDFFDLTREEARAKLGITDDRPVVVTTWGSLGAQVMNEHMIGFVKLEVQDGQPFHHIYGVGKRYYQRVSAGIAEAGIDLTQVPDVDVREYIYDMPVVMAAADLTIDRAGASTISEITALAKPSILVPSPNVTNNHQEKNARVLESKGGAVLLLEKDCTPELLYQTTRALLDDPDRRAEMTKALRSMQTEDAAEKIYETLCSLIRT